MSDPNDTMELNYAQIVGTAGLASRRELRKHKVRLRAPDGRRLNPRDKVVVRREPQTIHVGDVVLSFWLEPDALWAMNKPEGFVVSRSFDDGEPVYSILALDAPFETLEPIGRLDAETRGLLLFTEDGQLNQRMRHPSHEVPRTYLVGLSSALDSEPLAELEAGRLRLRDGEAPAVRELVSSADWPAAGYEWLFELCPEFVHELGAIPYLVTISEGRYHEVRRLFAALGSHVESLQRVRFGPFWLFPRGTDVDAARRALAARDSGEERRELSHGTLDLAAGFQHTDRGQRPNIPVFLEAGESMALPEEAVGDIYRWFGMTRPGRQLRVRFVDAGDEEFAAR